MSFSGQFARGETRGTNYYMPNTAPDALALRKATNAKPRRPVPSNIRDAGSGVDW